MGGGEWTQEQVLTGYGVDGVSVRGDRILVDASYDMNDVAFVVGFVGEPGWSAVDLGLGVRAVELADDGSTWLVRWDDEAEEGAELSLEHVGLCEVSLADTQERHALRPFGEGADVYFIDEEGTPRRRRYDGSCVLLSDRPLDAPPETAASYRGPTRWHGGSSVLLGGLWGAEEVDDGFEHWERPLCY